MAQKTEIIPEVKRIFSAYLESNNLGKTPERYSILEEIYQRTDHFDAETLYLHMKQKGFRVSRATVYNTLDLLVSCNLVARHQFGKNQAQYEKAYGFRQHDHLICIDCHRVLEFCDPRMQQIQTTMGNLLNFSINHHSLTMYGSCTTPNCEYAQQTNKVTSDGL